jgi:murein DD-endopeptidase MepM/ murein hydrolase activator NlpD
MVKNDSPSCAPGFASLCGVDSQASGKSRKSCDFPTTSELYSFLPDKLSVVSSKTRELARNFSDLINGKKNPRVPDLKFPVEGGVLSSAFGYRHGVFHSGLDITACKGEPVLACSSGKVVFTGSRKGYRSYGQAVLIDHGKEVYTHYAHLSRILVSKGQKVSAGDTIGLIGSTGRSTAPHLHLEVRVGSQLYNPVNYFGCKELKNIEIAKSFTDTPMGPVGTRRRLSGRY